MDFMGITFSLWDFFLIVVASIQGTAIAYIYDPKWKAFLLTLPFPFTFATLSLGRQIDATNVLALSGLLLFTYGVRWLYKRARLHIVLSIIASALGYCAIGSTIAKILPANDAIFWVSCLATIAVAIVLLRVLRPLDERGHRSDLPVWIKLPIIFAVVVFLVAAKYTLRGFMTVFPIVGVVASYEARYSLWANLRSILVLMLAMTPMLIVSRLTQESLGLGGSIALGWIAFVTALIPLSRLILSKKSLM